MSIAIPILLIIETLLLYSPVIFLYFKKKKQFDLFDPLVVFTGAFSIFYFFSQVYYYFSRNLPVMVDNNNLFITVILWSIIAIISFDVGYFQTHNPKKPVNFALKTYINPKKLLILLVVILAIVLAVYYLFMKSVGGFTFYMTHLNDTILLTTGKMYFVWGILLIRTLFLVVLVDFLTNIKNKTKLSFFLLGLFFSVTFVVIFTIGARILLLSFIIELIVLIHYAVKKISLKIMSLSAVFCLVFVVVIMGAWRNYGWLVKRGDTTPFFSYLMYDIKTNLGNRLFNNYFDSIKNFSYTLENTGDGMPIEYGRTYLALFIQPLPNRFRPNIKLDLSEEFKATRCKSIYAYCGIDSFMGELYQNFVFLGIPIGFVLLGLISGHWYKLIRSQKANAMNYVFYGIGVYSIFFILRGAFTGHMSLILMDIIPLFIIERITFSKNENRH